MQPPSREQLTLQKRQNIPKSTTPQTPSRMSAAGKCANMISTDTRAGIPARSFYGSGINTTTKATDENCSITAARFMKNHPPQVATPKSRKSMPATPKRTSPKTPGRKYHALRHAIRSNQPRLSSGSSGPVGHRRHSHVERAKSMPATSEGIANATEKNVNVLKTTSSENVNAGPVGGRKFNSRDEVIAAAVALIEKHAKAVREAVVAAKAAAVAADNASVDPVTQITQQQIDKLHRILDNRGRSTYILAPKTLNWTGGTNEESNPPFDTTASSFGNTSMLDASQLDRTMVENANSIDDTVSSPVPAMKRKFFKSDKTKANHQYTVMQGMCASVQRGAGVRLLSQPQQKRQQNKHRHSVAEYAELRAIQQDISDIISMLEDTEPTTEIVSTNSGSRQTSSAPNRSSPMDSVVGNVSPIDPLLSSGNYERFLQMIPYKTNDPETHRRQRTLLQLLETHNICTDRTFAIFIAEPERHEKEASKILDQLFQLDVVSSSQLPLTTDDDDNDLVDETDSDENVAVDQPTTLFPIFNRRQSVSDTNTTKATTAIRPHKTAVRNRIAWHANGDDIAQRQIDAGQKRFGGTQCAQCGMFYAQHEPADEALHQRFHDSAVRLQFRGWQEERVAATVPEWGRGGRIVCVRPHDGHAKRKRTAELVAVADEALGRVDVSASTSLSEHSVIFLAVLKRQVVGICVAEPVHTAFPLIVSGDDIDDLAFAMDLQSTGRTVRCGISRVWVCEAYQRQGIGRRLFAAVQSRFLGDGGGGNCTLRNDELAFEAPTEAGCRFAMRMMMTPTNGGNGANEVLVYQGSY